MASEKRWKGVFFSFGKPGVSLGDGREFLPLTGHIKNVLSAEWQKSSPPQQALVTQTANVSPELLKVLASLEGSQISHVKSKANMLKQMQHFPTSMGEQRYCSIALLVANCLYIFMDLSKCPECLMCYDFLWTLGTLQSCLYCWFSSTTSAVFPHSLYRGGESFFMTEIPILLLMGTDLCLNYFFMLFTIIRLFSFTQLPLYICWYEERVSC